MKQVINKRLLAVARMVRDGAVLADVGTDHAYLPIYLLSEGKIERAVLSDINRGPLMKAEENVRSAGFFDRVELRLCDGASSLKGLEITDYAICGMGGELIADIISHAPHLKDENVRLLLQPMSKPEALRSYLFDTGFEILEESYVTDEGKHYVCILAGFCGLRIPFSAADAHFGEEKRFEKPISSAMKAYMSERYGALIRTIEGKRLGGLDTKAEEELVCALKKRIDFN